MKDFIVSTTHQLDGYIITEYLDVIASAICLKVGLANV